MQKETENNHDYSQTYVLFHSGIFQAYNNFKTAQTNSGEMRL